MTRHQQELAVMAIVYAILAGQYQGFLHVVAVALVVFCMIGMIFTAPRR